MSYADEDGFHVTLPSDSSLNFFPDNQLTNFKTKLPKSIDLENGRWEVALTECHYPRTWMNVYITEGGTCRLLKNPTMRIDFPAFNKNTSVITNVVDFLNDWIQAYFNDNPLTRFEHADEGVVEITKPVLMVRWDEQNFRIVVRVAPNYQLVLSQQLAYVLGFETNDDEDMYLTEGVRAQHLPRLTGDLLKNTNRWYIVIEQEQDDRLKEYSIQLKAGYYNTPIDIIGELNDALKEHENIAFEYSKLDKKAIIVLPANGSTSMVLDKRLKTLLGFRGSKTITAEKTKGTQPMDLHMSFYNMYMYCDIVRPNIVGNILAPLLRVIQLKGQEGDFISQTYSPPYYKPLQIHHFDTIEILLRNDIGEKIPFKGGRVVLTLHFRRRRSRYV